LFWFELDHRKVEAMFLRNAALALTLSIVLGCASEHPPEYFKPPPPVALHDPPPGMSVVYLIRTPHDSQTVEVQVQGIKPFALPPEAHTVLLLKPGTYVIQGTGTGLFSAGKRSFAPVQLQTVADQRIFLYLSGITGRSVQVSGFVPLMGGGVMPLLTNLMDTDAQTRSWKNSSEQDAQGFLSITRYIRPD
jgi:hypothetical protein